jgi:hypothetical protein
MTVLAYSAIGTAFDSVGLKAALPNDLNKGC